MLRRFDSIKNNGNFQDFRWDAAVPEFERINLIYGTNGAGKTSLSRALDSLRSDRGGFTDVSIRLSDVDRNRERQSRHAHDAEFERVFVFSDAYVARSHDFGGDTQLDAVLTLGERTVEDEKRIVELNGLIEKSSELLTAAREAAEGASRALDNEYKTVSVGVVTALSRAGGEYRSNGSYSKGTVKARYGASRTDWALLSATDREAALATVNSDERQAVVAKSYSLKVRANLPGEVATALSASPVAVVLDTLKEHDEASEWVERGRHIHKQMDKCIFCGGILSEDRKTQIEQHFSDEVEEAQRITEGLIREITTLRANLRDLPGDGAVEGSLFEDLRTPFREAHAGLKTQVRDLDTWLGGLLGALEQKRANVVVRVDHTISEVPNLDGSQVERVLSDHNHRVSEHASLVQQAAKKVEWHLLKESEGKISELANKAQEADKAKTAIDDDLKAFREEVAALENIEGDPLPSAEVMAGELTRILGRNELSFELLPDGKHYRVTRYGEPARDLSTGERTAITLIHFLELVKKAGASSGKPIVVIDDPVSSLDSSTSTGISTYIWGETVSKAHIEQVFLMTHNFELFRQWDIQIDGLNGARGAANKKGFTSSCYELIAPHRDVNGVKRRGPEFIAWPPNEETRKKVRSSYHHAFITAARAHAALTHDSSLEKKLDALLLYPNVLRRMLETFLAFKQPASAGNFTDLMRDVGATLEELGYKGDADALRLQLTRFTHANSHADSPETDVAANPDEIMAILSAVFTFMNAVDQKHFEGLCEVIGIAPSELLLEVQPVVDRSETEAA